VIAALAGYLTKAGASNRIGALYGGALAAIGASIVAAWLFAVLNSGEHSDILEGLVILAAAGLMLYVSGWLMVKQDPRGWQEYLAHKADSALSQDTVWAVGALAFLAVFREGAETALFYVGIAPSIALGDLALGLGVGVAGLLAIGFAVLAFGMRIPIRPFFLGTSALVYYLAFKFLGTGIHALQVSGIVSANPRAYLPDLGLVGAFPTVETTLAQGVLLLAGLVWLASRRRFDTVTDDPRTMGTDPSARRRWQP
jgi:high-affinity iron transporter